MILHWPQAEVLSSALLRSLVLHSITKLLNLPVPAVIHIGRCQVVQRFTNSVMVVMFDKQADLPL